MALTCCSMSGNSTSSVSLRTFVVPLHGQVEVVDVIAQRVVLGVDGGRAVRDVLPTAFLEVAHFTKNGHKLQNGEKYKPVTESATQT